MHLLLLTLLLTLLSACTGGAEPEAIATDPDRPWRLPGDAIDSILPMEVMLTQFRTGMESPATLRSPAKDREELARQFLKAVAAGDSTTLSALLVNRAEFAWLLFPDHLYALPPYELDPAIYWLQIQASSAKGSARVLERYGRRPLEFRGLDCVRDTVQFVTGPTVAWAPCTVTYRGNDSTLTRRLFGTIVERDGVAKFMGYATEF
ncbi:MAG: hypothetical protein U0974_03795 [Gemmatimonadales bacterium]|nr:hypothetical protein [Gemmatimonadales bacterium]MDZ4388837.1 hypothetical protein [Gemmatimonadales bacterium]